METEIIKEAAREIIKVEIKDGNGDNQGNQGGNDGNNSNGTQDSSNSGSENKGNSSNEGNGTGTYNGKNLPKTGTKGVYLIGGAVLISAIGIASLIKYKNI